MYLSPNDANAGNSRGRHALHETPVAHLSNVSRYRLHKQKSTSRCISVVLRVLSVMLNKEPITTIEMILAIIYAIDLNLSPISSPLFNTHHLGSPFIPLFSLISSTTSPLFHFLT